MFIDRLLNHGNAPILEKMVEFSATRHRLITENIANIDTPDYLQKDLSIEEFQARLREPPTERDATLRQSAGGRVMHAWAPASTARATSTALRGPE